MEFVTKCLELNMSRSGSRVSKKFRKLKLFLESLGIKHNRNKLHRNEETIIYRTLKTNGFLERLGRGRIRAFHGNYRLPYRLN